MLQGHHTKSNTAHCTFSITAALCGLVHKVGLINLFTLFLFVCIFIINNRHHTRTLTAVLASLECGEEGLYNFPVISINYQC